MVNVDYVPQLVYSSVVFPPRDATLSSHRALSFDCAGMARLGPITAKSLAVRHGRKTVREFLTRRADRRPLAAYRPGSDPADGAAWCHLARPVLLRYVTWLPRQGSTRAADGDLE